MTNPVCEAPPDGEERLVGTGLGHVCCIWDTVSNCGTFGGFCFGDLAGGKVPDREWGWGGEWWGRCKVSCRGLGAGEFNRRQPQRNGEQAEEGAPVERDPETEPGPAGVGGRLPRGNPRNRATERSGTFSRVISVMGWGQKLEVWTGKVQLFPFLDAHKERRKAGPQVGGQGWGSGGFAPSGEMARGLRVRGVQGEGCNLHLVLLHLPHHLLPTGSFWT